jgi:hypothetical protein
VGLAWSVVERDAAYLLGVAVADDPRSGTAVARGKGGKGNEVPSTLLIDGNTTESAVMYETRKLFPNWKDQVLRTQ